MIGVVLNWDDSGFYIYPHYHAFSFPSLFNVPSTPLPAYVMHPLIEILEKWMQLPFTLSIASGSPIKLFFTFRGNVQA